MLAIGLLIVGGLALAYGGFSYTRSTQKAEIGPLSLTVKETETINIPIWMGLGTLLAGGVLLFTRK